MASRKANLSDTEEQRTQSAATPVVSSEAASEASEKSTQTPDAVSVALRNFVRALARAAAERDWNAAIDKLKQKGPDDVS